MNRILSIDDFIMLNESINDKNLLKFIFVAGGAGSGKSFILKNIFPDGRCKFYNIDTLLEYYSKMEEFTLNYDKATPDEKTLIKHYTGISMEIYSKKSYHWLNGMLPIVSDGTGMKSNFILDLKQKYEELGYDCYMIFVNTTKKVSVERNRKRYEDDDAFNRSSNNWFAEDSWEAAQLNLIEVYHKVFGGNKSREDLIDEIQAKMHLEDDYFEMNPLTQKDIFNIKAKVIQDNKLYIVNNNIDNVEKILLDKLSTLGNRILDLPIENEIGLKLISDLNKIGGKYRLDLMDSKYTRQFRDMEL